MGNCCAKKQPQTEYQIFWDNYYRATSDWSKGPYSERHRKSVEDEEDRKFYEKYRSAIRW